MDITLSALTEVYGNKKVIVDGCDSIVDFDENEVCVKSGRMRIHIVGKNLKVKLLIEKVAVIEGLIDSINYSYI